MLLKLVTSSYWVNQSFTSRNGSGVGSSKATLYPATTKLFGKLRNTYQTYIHQSVLHWNRLSCHIIGIVLNLKESDLKALLAQRLSEEDILRLSIEFDRDSSFTRHPQDSHSMDQKPLIPFKSETIGGVEKIAGIYIPALDGPKKKLLFEVSSTFDNLRKIALGLSSGRALCLQGPVGCGKTGLVEHLAACTGRQLGENFIKVQLGDQTDSKMLLGTYRCTDTPGEFIWQPGVLTQVGLTLVFWRFAMSNTFLSSAGSSSRKLVAFGRHRLV